MNASIKGMRSYYSDKRMRNKLRGIIQCADGYHLTPAEAWAFIVWCDENGIEDLYSAPDFHEVKDKLNYLTK